MPELKGLDYLRRRLADKRRRVDLRYKYYEMKNHIDFHSKLTPNDFRQLDFVLGWCAKAVDMLADRLVFTGFSNDDFELESIFANNSRDILCDDACLSSLISSCSFIYISPNENRYPRLQVIDGGNATGIIDPITRLLFEGYAVIERDRNNNILVEAYLTPGRIEIHRKGSKDIEVFENEAPYALLVPIVYRPDARRPFGHSRISRACMSLVQSALRMLLRSEVSSEFYSIPQKYVLGLSQDAEAYDKNEAAWSAFLQYDKDDEGDHPIVGQFQQASMSPFNDAMKNIASLFAGETGLTLDDLGYSTANPATPEAIEASHENLRLTARKAQRTFGSGFLNAGYLAACVRDKYAYNRSAFYQTVPRWAPIFEPSASQLGGIGDAVGKIAQNFPDYFTEEKLRDLTGI